MNMDPIRINESSTWYISNWPCESVIVPVDQFDGMSDEEIGRHVLALAPRVKPASAREFAQYLLSNRHISEDTIDQHIASLLPYADQDPDVQLAIRHLHRARQAFQCERQRKPILGKLGKRPAVYLVEAHGLYKIGWAKCLAAKLRSIDASLPCDVRLVCAIPDGDIAALEDKLFLRFEPRHANGEWMDLKPEIVAKVEAIARQAVGEDGG